MFRIFNTEKCSFIIVFYIVTSSIFCIGDLDYHHMPVSSTQIAMGYRNAMGSYIWSNNPLNVWQNPAILGYQDGLSIGYYKNYYDKYFKESASMVSLGWRGIGILLPSYNEAEKFGHTLDWGEYRMTNEDGSLKGTGHSYTTTSQYALGVNLMKMINWRSQKEEIFDLSLGLSLMYYRFLNEREYVDSSVEHENRAPSESKYMLNMGVLGRISPLQNIDTPFGLDITVGYTDENMNAEDEFVYRTTYSGAVRGSLKSSVLRVPVLNDFVDDLVSVTLTEDYSDMEDSYITNTYSQGLELGVFSTFYLRFGHYFENNNDKEENYDMIGYGLKFHYKDWAGFEWNYSESEEDAIFAFNDTWDMMLNVNLWKIIDAM